MHKSTGDIARPDLEKRLDQAATVFAFAPRRLASSFEKSRSIGLCSGL